MQTFTNLWQSVIKRSVEFPIVQERSELEHVFNLIQGCESYLEVGTAEGNSLFVLAHALKPGARITSVDLGERHTKPHQEDVRRLLSPHYTVAAYHGDSTNPSTYPNKEKHDAVLIDGGHDFNTVLSDANMYGLLATKYILFHDIKLPDVARAVNKFLNDKNPGNWRYSEYVNSPTMGFGIVEIR